MRTSATDTRTPAIDERLPAGLRRRRTAGGVDIWSVDLDRVSFAPGHDWETLSPAEQARAVAFATDVLRARFVSVRLAVRIVLARYLGGLPREVPLTSGPYGKPAVDFPPAAQRTETGGRIEFNLSHSGGQAVIAVTRDRAVGVDLERMQPDFDPQPLVERFFSAVERQRFAALPTDLQRTAFYHAWTCKEAYLKALGAGLHVPLDEFDVSVDPRRPPRLLRGHASAPGPFALHALPVPSGFAGALALSLEPFDAPPPAKREVPYQ